MTHYPTGHCCQHLHVATILPLKFVPRDKPKDKRGFKTGLLFPYDLKKTTKKNIPVTFHSSGKLKNKQKTTFFSFKPWRGLVVTLIWKCILWRWWGTVQSKGKNGLPEVSLLLVVLFHNLPCWLKASSVSPRSPGWRHRSAWNHTGLCSLDGQVMPLVWEVHPMLLNLPSLPTAVPCGTKQTHLSIGLSRC